MRERRMFSKQITSSDAFQEMPLSSQALYFHLGMEADDDGFINSPIKITRIIGANKDDLNILVAKKFIIAFESGVIVVKHWNVNNTIRLDRKKPTQYQKELRNLHNDNGNYSLQPNDNQVTTESPPKLSKVKLSEVNISEGNDNLDATFKELEDLKKNGGTKK